MKKLMIAAAAVAMIGVTEAATPYVYRMEMKIKTTQGASCEKEAAAGCFLGSDGLVRVADNYNVRGFLYGCWQVCGHLLALGNSQPNTWKLLDNDPTQQGEIFWDTVHHWTILPKDATTAVWNSGNTAPVKFTFMDVIGAELDQSETLFVFSGKAAIPNSEPKAATDPAPTYVYNEFNMMGAGFGEYSNVSNWWAWTRMSGNMAGQMTAPYVVQKGNNTYIQNGAQAQGLNCASATCGGTTVAGATAAYGTWTIALDKTLSTAYGTKYGKAIKPYIPSWILH